MANPIQNVLTGLHRLLYRASGGRVGSRIAGLDVLLLTTTGSKSGQPRTTPLGFLRDGDAYVIVASNGGSDRHPAWYFNLRNDPRARLEIGGETFEVTAETMQGAERARVWSRVVQAGPGYAGYERRTSREIPLVRLTRS